MAAVRGEYMTYREVAARLAVSISTVRRAVARGDLPAPVRTVATARVYRFRRTDVERYARERDGSR